MSPSNSSKSHTGEPAPYQHLKQELFAEIGNSSSSISGNRIETATALGDHIPTGNINSQVPSNSNGNPEHSNANTIPDSSNTRARLDAHTGESPTSTSTSNLPSNPGLSEGTSGIVPSHVVVTLEGAKPVKPRPLFTGIECGGASASEATRTPIAAASAVATLANDSPSTTAPERTPTTKSKGSARRRGKWTAEEEEYVARVIQDFNFGFLNAPAGYTLRSYLSDKLQCDPMRITKKFTGESCIGKRVFHPAVRTAANAIAIDKAQVRIVFVRRACGYAYVMEDLF